MLFWDQCSCARWCTVGKKKRKHNRFWLISLVYKHASKMSFCAEKVFSCFHRFTGRSKLLKSTKCYISGLVTVKKLTKTEPKCFTIHSHFTSGCYRVQFTFINCISLLEETPTLRVNLFVLGYSAHLYYLFFVFKPHD